MAIAFLARRGPSSRDSNYGPSILIDMEQGRQTEAEHTIGDMVEKAMLAGVSARISLAALCNLQVHEERRRSRVPLDRDFRTYI